MSRIVNQDVLIVKAFRRIRYRPLHAEGKPPRVHSGLVVEILEVADPIEPKCQPKRPLGKGGRVRRKLITYTVSVHRA